MIVAIDWLPFFNGVFVCACPIVTVNTSTKKDGMRLIDFSENFIAINTARMMIIWVKIVI